MTDDELLPGWSIDAAREFARSAKALHAPARQTMPDGRANPYDRCALCSFARFPCDMYEMATLLFAALDPTRISR